MHLFQSSVLLLVLSGMACTMEVKGEDQAVAVVAQNLSPVHLGTVKVSDLLAGLIQGQFGLLRMSDQQIVEPRLTKYLASHKTTLYRYNI